MEKGRSRSAERPPARGEEDLPRAEILTAEESHRAACAEGDSQMEWRRSAWAARRAAREKGVAARAGELAAQAKGLAAGAKGLAARVGHRAAHGGEEKCGAERCIPVEGRESF